MQKDLELVNGLSLDQVLRKKWYPSENSPQGAWDHVAEDMLLRFAESGHPIFRATTPLSRGQLKSKGKGKVSIHFSADPDTVDTIYRITLSVNQLSIYGAVAVICDEYEGHPDSTGKPVTLEGQSIVLGKIKAEAPAREELEDAKIILQKYFQQVNSLSPENRLSKFCKEAGFMSVVEVGQYFVTRNASEFLHTVACREYTLPRDDPASEPKGWIRGNTRIGSFLEVTTSFQHFQIRSRSSNPVCERRQFSVLGQNLLWNSSLCEQLHQIRHAKSCRSTRRGICTNKLRSGCSQIEGKSKTSDYLGSIIYLRALQGHSGDSLIDLALQDNVLIGPGVFPYVYHVGSTFNLHSVIGNGLTPGGQNLSRRQSVFFLLVDPRDEDHKDPENVDYSVPRHARYVQNTWKRHQDTVFWIDIDLGIIKEGLKFYQTRSNAIILKGALPANCSVRAERLKSGEKLYERQYLSPRPPPKISLRHDLNWNKGQDQGSTVEHRPVGKLVQQSLGETFQFGSSKPTKSPKPIEDRSGKPAAQEIVGKLQEELSSSDRSGKPATEEEQHVRNHDGSGKPDREEKQHTVQEDCHLKSRDKVDQFDLATDDANVDFSVSGIPEEAVKRSENFNILQLILRITSHPQQEAVQNDLERQQSFNAFSNESKVAIMDAGNIEISEIVNAEPKWQCKVCLNHCSTGVIYCVCGRLMTRDSAENRKYISAILDTFSIPNFYIRKNRPHGHKVWKITGMQRILYGESTCKEMP